MTTFYFQTHISADGVISLPGWTGGEAEVEITLALPAAEEDAKKKAEERKKAVMRFMELWSGCMSDYPDKNITMKQIRAMRLEERYGADS